MELTGSSLLLLADGRRARLFEERLRGGPLTEITDRLGDLAAEAPVASGSGGRVRDRMGRASHTTGGPGPHEKREEAFVSRVGARAAEEMRRGDYRDLILVAAPRALGQLRRIMEGEGLSIALAEPHDRLTQTPESLRESLRELRRRS